MTDADADGLAIDERDGAVLFDVRVSPRASREKVLGVHAGALKLSLSAPPVDGAANDALVTMLARMLSVPRSAIAIVRGEHSRSKRVCVDGVDASAVRALLRRPPSTGLFVSVDPELGDESELFRGLKK